MGREHYLCLGMSRRDVGVVGSDSSRFRRIDRPRKGLIVGTGKSPHTEGKFGRRFIGGIAIKVELMRLFTIFSTKTEITSQGDSNTSRMRSNS